MTYCSKCGTELSEDAKFCPKCGTSVQTSGVVFRKEPFGLHIGRVFAIIFGVFILLVAFGLIAGGGVLVWSQTAMTDSQGYMVTRPAQFSVGSYAIVQSNINVNVGNGWMMIPRNQDIVTLKIEGISNNGKPIFIGVARQTDVQNYLNDVNVDRFNQYTWMHSPWSGSGTPTYQTIQGGAPASAPTTQSFWIEQATGTGTQTMIWSPISGDYWVVVMNADGSKAVDVDMQLGVRVTVLNWVGYGLLVGGLITALIGVVILYYGAIRRP